MELFETTNGDVCKLVKLADGWIIQVDGHEIPFKGDINKEYFEKKYRALGYDVITITIKEAANGN